MQLVCTVVALSPQASAKVSPLSLQFFFFLWFRDVWQNAKDHLNSTRRPWLCSVTRVEMSRFRKLFPMKRAYTIYFGNDGNGTGLCCNVVCESVQKCLCVWEHAIVCVSMWKCMQEHVIVCVRVWEHVIACDSVCECKRECVIVYVSVWESVL